MRFRGLVDAAGQRTPEGWIPGRGFVTHIASRPTLAEWFERSLAARHRANEKTKADYRRDFVRHVPAWLQARPVDKITHEDVGVWLSALARQESRGRPLSRKTIKNIHGTVSSVLRDAQRDGLIQRNPFEGALTGSAGPAPERVFLTQDEFGLLREHLPRHYQDFFTLLYQTGLRLGEAIVLRPASVDLTNERLTVSQAWKRGGYIGDPKSAQSVRTIAISSFLANMLEQRMRHEFLFLNQHGTRLKGNSLHNHVWSPAVRRAGRAGLGKVPRIHDLRHSHAAYLISQGIPLLAVSRRLGHASVQVTASVYGHLLPEVDTSVKLALGKLDEHARRGQGARHDESGAMDRDDPDSTP